MRYTVYVWKQLGGDLPPLRGLSAQGACKVIRYYFRGSDGKLYIDTFKDSKQLTAGNDLLQVIVKPEKPVSKTASLSDLEGD